MSSKGLLCSSRSEKKYHWSSRRGVSALTFHKQLDDTTMFYLSALLLAWTVATKWTALYWTVDEFDPLVLSDRQMLDNFPRVDLQQRQRRCHDETHFVLRGRDQQEESAAWNGWLFFIFSLQASYPNPWVWNVFWQTSLHSIQAFRCLTVRVSTLSTTVRT